MTSEQAKPRRGYLFIVSGPSGVGKTVLCNSIVEKFHPDVVYSISATSRDPRGSETDGQEYFFYSREEFEAAIERQEFAEWAFVHGNYYGTPCKFVEDNLNAGTNVILNIDVQGALSIRSKYPESIMIFILPPSLEELESRIRKRNIDSESSLRHRLENARQELGYQDQYKFCIVNDDLDKATEELWQIFAQHISELKASDGFASS